MEPSEGAWVAIRRNSSSSVILSIELSADTLAFMARHTHLEVGS